VDLIQTASPCGSLPIVPIIGKRGVALRGRGGAGWRYGAEVARGGATGPRWRGVALRGRGGAGWRYGAEVARGGVAPCYLFPRASNARGETQQNFKITYSKRNNIS